MGEQVYVDSVAYNMAGPIEDRPAYLKTIVARSVMTGGRHRSIADDIVRSQLSGPSMDQRAFFRWANTNFPEGKMVGTVRTKKTVDGADVAPYITVPGGGTLNVNAAFIDTGDIIYWAEQHLLASSPALLDTTWIADYDADTDELVIYHEDTSVETVALSDFAPGDNYIVAYYTISYSGSPDENFVYIYKIGSGTAPLDALLESTPTIPEFFPVIPLRIDNVPVDHEDFEDVFPKYARAYKKAFEQDIEDVLANIEDNESIDDIDYAFVVHGVELNTQERVGKRYLYEFFLNLMEYQETSPAEFASWVAGLEDYDAAVEALSTWIAAQEDTEDPLYGTPRPVVPSRITPDLSLLRVSTVEPDLYDMRLRWLTIEETTGAGLGKPDAVKGDLWFEVLDDLEIPGVNLHFDVGETTINRETLPQVRLYWQDTETSYRALTIYGLRHETFVYEGHTVRIKANEALGEEDESGFIVPLHYPSLKAMPLVQATQLAGSNRLIVFNCYKVVKLRWYQTGIFRILFAIVFAVITAIFFPAAGGLLGNNFLLGSSLGFTGTAAAIVGSIANSIAAALLVTVIEAGATAIFGDKLGAIIGAIASFFAFQYVMNFSMHGSLSINWGDLMKADNLLKLTNSVAGAITNWAQAEFQDLQEELGNLTKKYQKEMQEIEKKTLELLGYGGQFFDPLMLVQLGSSPPAVESSQTFLNRTLLTGSDVAEISLDMIGSFAETTLKLPDPIP